MDMTSNKKQLYFLLYVVFSLFFFYAAQDFLTSRNGTGVLDADRRSVHMALFVILMTLGAYYSVTTTGVLVTRHTIDKSPVKIALWLITVWIVIVNLLQGEDEWRVAVHLGISMLWILIYHFFCRYLRVFPQAWPQMQLCIMIMFGFYIFSATYAAYFLRSTYGRIAVVNLVYGMLVFLPWISLVQNKKVRRLGYSLAFLVVMVSMKRGAIVAFPLMLGASMIVDAVVMKKKLRPITRYVSSMVLFLVGLLVVDQWSGGFLSERFSPEQLAGGSGRTEMYLISIEDILQRSPWDMLIGRGSGSSIELLGTGVHNEWLEFIFSFGVIGAILYALLFYCLGGQTLQLIKRSSPYASAYAMAVVYMLVVGMFGGIYFVHSTLYIMALFGAVEGMQKFNPRTVQVQGKLFISDNRLQGTVKWRP